MLEEGARWFSEHVGAGLLEARVRKTNARSLGAFRKAGYQGTGDEGDWMVLTKKIGTPDT